MTAPRRYGLRSLSFKLVLASVVVEALMLTVLVWNSSRITGNAMQEIFQNRVENLIPMITVGLAGPLVQRDYATLDERLGRIVHAESLVYIEVRDVLGKIAASRGEVPVNTHLDTSFEVLDQIYDQAFDLTLANQVIGRARYGLNVRLLAETVTSLRRQGALLASAEIVLTVLLLAILGALLTSHLFALAQAASTLAGGDYTVRVPATGRDEVAETAHAFNAMATTIERDIADRQRTQEALQQSEQRLRNIIDGLGPSMFVGLLTTEGVVLEANQQALAAAGLKPEDVLGKPLEETYWINYSEESKCQMRATITRAAQGEASRYDLQIRAAENQFIPLDFSIQPFRDATGRVVLLVPSAIVIAERKQAEAALRESEERLRLALDAAHMGTFDWDVPNNRITWSRWHEELWGFKPGEFGGTYEAFSQRVHPGDLPGINADVARCIATREPFTYEFRVVWPDGSVHWIAGRGEFSFGADGQPQRMRGAVIETTERKQAEAALRQSEDHFRTLFEQAMDGILVSDVQGHFLDANPAACQMLGYAREELLTLKNADIMAAGEVARIVPETGRLLSAGVVRSEWQLRRRDGSTLLAELSAKSLPDGRLQGLIRDITARRRAEDSLQQLTQELEQRVIERTEELQIAQRELRAKNQELEDQNELVQKANRLKSEFLANMSHELRTPLNAIIGFSELMHDGKVGAVAPNHKEYLGDILNSGKHLLQLINGVLDLAKVESGKMEFHPEPVNLSSLASEVRDVLRTLMAHKRIGVAIEVEPALTGIVADPVKLKQVLYNYLSNAIKFSATQSQVIVRGRAEDAQHFRLEVEDQGAGIRAEDLHQLFVEFQQLDRGAAKKHAGTGLGLALTKRIVEAQGGHVGVTSVPDQGSVFYAVLPRVMRASAKFETRPL